MRPWVFFLWKSDSRACWPLPNILRNQHPLTGVSLFHTYLLWVPHCPWLVIHISFAARTLVGGWFNHLSFGSLTKLKVSADIPCVFLKVIQDFFDVVGFRWIQCGEVSTCVWIWPRLRNQFPNTDYSVYSVCFLKKCKVSTSDHPFQLFDRYPNMVSTERYQHSSCLQVSEHGLVDTTAPGLWMATCLSATETDGGCRVRKSGPVGHHSHGRAMAAVPPFGL